MKSLLLSALILTGSIQFASAQREAWRVTPHEVYEVAATGAGGCVAIQRANGGPWKAVVYTAKGTVQAEATLTDFDPGFDSGPVMATSSRFYIYHYKNNSPVLRRFSIKKGAISFTDTPVADTDTFPFRAAALDDKAGFFVFRSEEGSSRIIRYQH